MAAPSNSRTPAAAAPFLIPPETLRALILALWAVLLCCVTVGSLAPALSPVMVAVSRLQVNDKTLHFAAYAALAFLPVVGFRNGRKGIVAGLSMLLFGVLLEAGQHFSIGRGVETADVIANSACVACGMVFAFPVRARMANPAARL